MLDPDSEYVEETEESVVLQPVDSACSDIGHDERVRLRRVVRRFHSVMPVGRSECVFWIDSNGRMYREAKRGD